MNVNLNKNINGYNLINNTKNNLTNINNQIANLKLIEKNSKKEFSREDVAYASAQIKNLTHQKSELKNLLIQQKYTAETETYQNEVKSLSDRLVIKRKHLENSENKIFNLERRLSDLNNVLKNFEWIRNNERVNIANKINEQSILISECKNEISQSKYRSEELKSGIQLELKKIELLKELQENLLAILNLKAVKGQTSLENVDKAIEKAKLRITELKKELTTTPLNERTVSNIPATAISKPTLSSPKVTSTYLNGFINLSVDELQKWLSENFLEKGFERKFKESLIAIALLTFTKTNSNSSNVQHIEDEGFKEKIKNVAIGACEKFCMTKVMEHVISSNPLLIAAFGFGILAQHYAFDDGNILTLGIKVKRFALGESIKACGKLLLGTAVVGGIGNALAFFASIYLVYSLFTSTKDPMKNLYDAGIEMLADLGVDKINNNCSSIL